MVGLAPAGRADRGWSSLLRLVELVETTSAPLVELVETTSAPLVELVETNSRLVEIPGWSSLSRPLPRWSRSPRLVELVETNQAA